MILQDISTVRRNSTKSSTPSSYSSFFLATFSTIALVVVIVALIRIFKSKEKEKESAEYISHVIAAQEAERNRISCELHDTLAQDLRIALSKTENKQMHTILYSCISLIRSMCYNLAPPDLVAQTLSQTIQGLCVRIHDESSLDVSLAMRIDALPLID